MEQRETCPIENCEFNVPWEEWERIFPTEVIYWFSNCAQGDSYYLNCLARRVRELKDADKGAKAVED